MDSPLITLPQFNYPTQKHPISGFYKEQLYSAVYPIDLILIIINLSLSIVLMFTKYSSFSIPCSLTQTMVYS